MAYAATKTYNGASAAGTVRDGEYIEVLITETEGAAASETTITLPPGIYDLVRYDLARTSGTAATFDPIFGGATGASGINRLARIVSTPTAYPLSTQGSAIMRTTQAGLIYYLSQPNAGSDNSVSVRATFKRLGSL